MPDYTKDTGNRGEMMIRDTGTVVEFWITANEPNTWVNEMPWAYVVNGVSSAWREFRYARGAGWEKVGSWNVTTDQTVTFKLGNTGTNALGGPTNFSVAIERSTTPSAPKTPTISSIKNTSVIASFVDGNNGGAAINQRQIGYGLSSSSVQEIVNSDGSTSIGGLDQGKTYYFWARTRNVHGYSPWSGRASAVTLAPPSAPTTPLLSSVTATSVDVAFTPNSSGGATIIGYQIGYGTNASAPTTTVSARSPQVVSGLTPGTVYYFWARAQSSVGWGPWSARASTRTVAGVSIYNGSQWKLAVPYVKVDGVWRMAEAWTRNTGVWKRTI